MRKVLLRESLHVSNVALGCWRMDRLDDSQAARVVSCALENGINFFDHADIYGNGISEENFAKAWKSVGVSREKIVLQSKAGIDTDNGIYDFSAERIERAVEGSLRRLQTEYLDVLLLHRPDTLFEPEEVAEAFTRLYAKGKVRFFGVSNQNPMQIELLRDYVQQELIINQMQFNPAHAQMVSEGLCVNNMIDGAIVRDGGVLEYCRRKHIAMQAWSPFQFGCIEGVYLDHPNYLPLNQTLRGLAEEYHVTPGAIVVAWILRHPAFAQCVVGSMTPERIGQLCKGSELILTKKQWYDIYKAAGNKMP